MATVGVRYITDDTDAAVAFYVERLGCTVEARPGPGFAALFRDDLRLLLNHLGQAARATDARRPPTGEGAVRCCSTIPPATRSSSSSPRTPEQWSSNPDTKEA
jgi:catechol 2,3-dioxygenase-like lactoylglutathione lyase family enzyme